ncbi:hypothetical protein A2867_05200 [Candidatus Daviesbacteria bacterium RIFCSPHIGHO2_01_FULL_40_11]|uniref:Glycosyltransferase RgtA/B/C/D-like domain-containing protein n=1 Tax=Candidatus Daviesbacteria bacterium RIFCSPHIGHO2_01_FULL_40_11 TaxID=1797762 RepID=A0A1F5JKT5_9BACT|nr:MAG: hypothetical protein A2867_05200 [Candidatus Daviesbacteria bacterium RIFCSPHIGHO2_01_FULL_40_11]OGE63167.1 MAG: hypothetical protein A2964_01035 [Candidatus Daviesbacteria bacterium RIFCSPLOWO2_01_FULL_40_27]
MWAKILLLFFVFSFLFRTDYSFDQDLGRHLRLGEIILQTKSVPQTNLFSYTYPDFPFINSHWLFEVLVYLGQQTIGLQALLFLKVAIILLAVWLVLKVVPKNQYLLLPIGFIFLHTLRERPELRPEILSFLFTGATFYLLDRYEKTKTKLIFTLPLIQLLWVNSHIYFIVGLFLQAIYLVHLGYQHLRSHPKGVNINKFVADAIKPLGVIFLLSVMASLINPSGIRGFLNPLTFNQNYGYTIVENQTMFFLENIGFRNPNFLFVKLATGIIILSILIAFFKRRLLLKNLGLAGLGLLLTMLNVRSFPYLALISFPAVLENFGAAKSFLWTKMLISITAALLLIESFLYLNGSYYKYTDSDTNPRLEFKEGGRGALDFVLKNNLPQPVFNNFDIGSYITYRAYPKYRIFVDGRPGEYPKEFFQEVYIPVQYEPQKFKELDQKLSFKTIIFSHTDQTPWGKAFLASIVKNPGWKTVYLDDFMIVLVKSDVASQGDTLESIDLSKLDPAAYSYNSYISYLRLSLFLVQIGHPESAEKFARTGLSLFPQSPLGNTLFGIKKTRFFW